MSNLLQHIKIVTVLIITLLLPLPIQAFAPGGSATIIEGSLGAGFTEGKSHESITEDALNEIYKEYGFGDGTGLKPLTTSMKEAIKAIKLANAEVDAFSPNESRYHCDAEQLQECSELIRAEADLSVKSLKKNSTWLARSYLGSAFHTLQDFYSHSNWIELGHNEPNTALGKPQSMGNLANPNDTNKCRQAPAWNLCDEGNITTSLLTSGYYGGQDRTKFYKLGMCRHGGGFDHTEGSGGINKDSSTCYVAGFVVSPH